MHSNLANNISAKLEVPLTKNLGKYLGMPFILRKEFSSTYNYILDRVYSKLAGWKSRTLSFVGWMILIKSVTSSLQVYAMQTIELPRSIYNEIDKCNKIFL